MVGKKKETDKPKRKPRTKYYYVAALYNTFRMIDDVKVSGTSSISWTSATSCEETPKGFPAWWEMVEYVKKLSERRGEEYIEGSFFIIEFVRLTKDEFELFHAKEHKPKINPNELSTSFMLTDKGNILDISDDA